MDKQLNILVLDDDPIIRNLLRSMLKEKTNVMVAEKPSSAFDILKKEAVDVLISDFVMPEMNGLEVLARVKEEHPDVEVIMISSEGNMDTVIGALRQGAVDYFKKPFKAEDLWVAIERTKKFAELNASLKAARSQTRYLQTVINEKIGDTIVGKTAGIEEIKKQMQMVARTQDTSVLILGESGTGKELVARGIHQLSARKDEVFGAVNMSAVPESLFESEFFGHKKGSFTGAVADKAGWFEVANKGTLFFDEIGEMEPSLQVKLLRVLEDRKYTRVGTQKEQSFDIRIVAATNKTVEEMSSGKNFRADLYYRLSTFTIFIPPLRDRKEDIPLLAEFFFHNMVKKMGKSIGRVHPAVMEMLRQYPFPGNIRELRNLMERAVIICEGKELLPNNFPDMVRAHGPAAVPAGGAGNTATGKKAETEQRAGGTMATDSAADPAGGKASRTGGGAEEAEPVYDLREIEKNTILRALEATNFNKNEAAKLLNLEWNALYRRMQKYGIN
jgi:DNA-binding NtrC family response regulator